MSGTRIWPPPSDLRGLIDLSYSARVGLQRYPVLPDGRGGVVWLSDGTLRVCGPETEAWRPERSGVEVVGVRCSLGAMPAVLGVSARDLVNRRIPLEEFWGNKAVRLAERVTCVVEPRARATVLEDALRSRCAGTSRIDHLMVGLAHRLAHGACSVQQMAIEIGLSERQLRRRFEYAFGYPPSVLSRLLRLQRFLSLARSDAHSADSMAALAAAAGYADQAHLARDSRLLVGHRASTLLNAVGHGPTSDPFKTARQGPPTVSPDGITTEETYDCYR